MHLSPSHLDTGKASILNLGAGQIRLAQIPTLQIDVLKIDLPAIGPPQVREEEIGDLAFNQLRAGVENADKDSIAEERRLVRARRAVEKAVHLLSGSS